MDVASSDSEEQSGDFDVHELTVDVFLGPKPPGPGISCIKVPRYQRHYGWKVEQAHALARDIVLAGSAKAGSPKSPERPHWIGALIWNFASKGNGCDQQDREDFHECCEVVDGQQRLGSLYLWAHALKAHAKEYLNPPIKDLDLGSFKTIPMHFQKRDSEVYELVIAGGDVSDEDSQVAQIYTYFRYLLWLGGDSLTHTEPSEVMDRRLEGNLTDKFVKLHKRQLQGTEAPFQRGSLPSVGVEGLLKAAEEQLSIISIRVKTDAVEVASEVFDALNGRRLELNQFDHLRHYCFTTMKKTVRDKYYDDYWVKAEKQIDEVRSVTNGFDDFLYNYLISVGQAASSDFKKNRAYGAFRKYQKTNSIAVDKWVSNELGDAISRWRFALHPVGNFKSRGKEVKITDVARAAIARIRLVSEGPPIPLLMVMLDRVSREDSDAGYINGKQFEKLVVAFEGFLFKARLAGQSHTNLRSRVMKELPQRLKEWETDPATGESAFDKMYKSIQELSPKWVDIEKFMKTDWKSHSEESPQGAYTHLRGGGPVMALFDAIEETMGTTAAKPLCNRFGKLSRRAEAKDNGFEIDHIYPRSPDDDWTKDLKDWSVKKKDMTLQVHRLGNLAPVVWRLNREWTNKSLKFKLSTKGFKNREMPSLQVNKSWMASNRKKWKPSDIDKRETVLLKVMKKRWP